MKDEYKTSIVAQKSYSFALRIINAYKYLINKNEYVISKQLLRSGTSIGANCREAKNVQSKLDFISKLNIALKEADETAYWLELLKDSSYIPENLFISIYTDCIEIVKILTSIIKTIKNNISN